jgi:hypothetical protein
LDGALEMAQRSMIDEYVRYVASGNILEARLMLKSAFASDDRRGDVRVLLEMVETLDSSGQRSQSQPAPGGIHN